MANDRFAAFVERMTSMLEDKFPDWCTRMRLEGRSLNDLVLGAIEEAKGYGVEAEGDLEMYIQCLALLSRTFASDMVFPWAYGILRRSDLSGSQKMDKIHDHLVFRRS